MTPPVSLRSVLRAAVGAAALVAAGCAAATPGDVRARGELTADLFPTAASRARFAMSRGPDKVVRVEPTAAGAVVWIGADGGGASRIDVTRSGDDIVFSGGPNAATALIRIGAAPGAAWTSGPTSVHFDGWERISVPAGTYDAARIRATSGPETLQVIQTWWFAPGTGIVQLRSDRGGIFGEEMSLAAVE